MSSDEGVWSGHFFHRWSKWLLLEVTTSVTRWVVKDGPPVTRVESVETLRYRTCEICGLEQRER